MRNLLAIVLMVCVAQVVYAQDITKSLWFNEEKEAKIQFYEQDGKLFGKIVWLKEPKENGKDKTDKNNSKQELRGKPIVGLVILKNFKKDGKGWEDGEIYDPKSGKTYSSTIKWSGENQLNIRGFIGVSLVGRTTKFTRTN